MSDAIDKYFTPMILHENQTTQEMVYKDILNYCKILQGKEWPWNELYMDTRRSDLHNLIASIYCDCDDSLVSNAIEKVFYPGGYDVKRNRIEMSDEKFLKNVDRLMEELKDIARLPHKKRYPSLIPEEGLDKIAESLKGIPDMGEISNDD